VNVIVRDTYGGPEVIRLEEADRPNPGPGEVLVRVRAASLNTADLDHLRGRPRVARVGTGLSVPSTRALGFDLAGEVEAVGADVTRFRPGDGVWADLFGTGVGSFAEYVCAPEAALVPKPPDLSYETAATMPHSALLALQGLRARRHIRPGMRVLVIGAGGCVGPFAVQIARALGAEVTGVDHTGKLELMRTAGADHVIDYTKEDVTRNGQRYDRILDVVGNRSVLSHRRSLRRDGVYVQIARTLGGFFSAAVLGGMISIAVAKKMGVFMWVPNREEDLAYLSELVRSCELSPVVDRRIGLSDVPEGLRRLEAGEARGKIVVVP
jgi:NADPH:quinone reductase-like Zn-dependent oxidoreductase